MSKKKIQSKELSLREQVQLFPLKSGVYLMRNKIGKIIYVGKAKSIRSRVKSYFSKQNTSKVVLLMTHVKSIEYIVTSTEHEALLLENNLIKQHKPKYNILLKDDKTFPVIKITNEEYPRVIKTRTIAKDKGTYYGPYVHGGLLDVYLKFIEKIYPLRRCRKIKERKNPCLYYHINRCAAVCANKTNKQEYNLRIQKIHKLLQGDTKKLKKEFTIKMHEYSQKLAFEDAQKYRDAIIALEKIEQSHNIIHDETSKDEGLSDYIGYAVQGNRGCIVIMNLQAGKVVDVKITHAHVFDDEKEPLEQFLISTYHNAAIMPKKIILPVAIGEETSLFLKSEYSLVSRFPKSHEESSVVKFANDNAFQALRRRTQERGDIYAVQELKSVLKLPQLPTHIEGFDIAHVAGKHMVAAMVVFINGVSQNSLYRHFKIKALKEGQVDDYAALQEAVTRRYTRMQMQNEPLPDLIVIDGGQGQVNSVQKIIEALKINMPIVGLAKKNEEIFFPSQVSERLQKKNKWFQTHVGKKSLLLPKSHHASRLLQAIRDEAHRFGTTFRAKKQSDELSLSLYTSVEGIGMMRAKKIVEIFHSPEAVKNASLDVLCKSIGITKKVALELQKVLQDI